MRPFYALMLITLLFSSCSLLPAQRPILPPTLSPTPTRRHVSLATSSPTPTRQSIWGLKKNSKELLRATAEANVQTKTSAIGTSIAGTIAARPTFPPTATVNPAFIHLPTLTPIAPSTPVTGGAIFDVSPDVLGANYQIESTCYFDTQSGRERYEIYAGAV